MADPLPGYSGTAIGVQFALKIVVRHVVVGLGLSGETLARDLEANADVLEQMGAGDVTAHESSKVAAASIREVAGAAREAEAERQSNG